MTIYPNLEDEIHINFFSGPKKRNLKSNSQKSCFHLGTLAYNGYNRVEDGKFHRVKCLTCGKRFGRDIEMWNLLSYQQEIKMILYELFDLKYPLTGVAKRWGIPQEKLSRFKKWYISQVFQQNSELIEQKLKALPRGVILGDETYMGSRGNSNAEIVFINNDYETLSTGPVDEGELKESILKAFEKIPEACRKKLKILITDGEPSYKSIAKQFGSKVIHVAQLHNKDQRGEIIISKYQKLGPHYLHFKIYTHWKAFYRDKHELKFKWEIKFIKGRVQAKRGRPRNSNQVQNKNARWRQKLENYQSDSFQKEGSAKIYVNFETNKLSMRAGAKKWMIQMLTPIFKIFKGKHVTTNLMESKHSQIKGNGAGKKQRDAEYGHQLFALNAFFVEFHYLPFTNLAGRPLYKYLMIESKKKEVGYRILDDKRESIQTVLSAFN
ncbi:hypothetical protein LCGC14_0494530 [marine sediment metagenome]|uniref:Uncharacterized protein n=1 Tax=marine sediment metagenome TaxID=412755 RepID=A0A0F9SAT5_9ZZZZ